jgi:small subunit ribosomal protein S21
LIKVTIQDNESIDKVLKRFKKKYEKAGVLKEVRKRGFFVKPSIKKRMKKAKAIRRNKRTLAEESVS